jgi:hypothetical protein
MNRSEVNRRQFKQIVIDLKTDLKTHLLGSEETKREAERRIQIKQSGDWETDGGALSEKPQKKEPRPLDPKSDTYLQEIQMGGEGCPNVP